MNLGGLRGTVVVLALLGVTLQGQLWLSDDGYRKTRALREAVESLRDQNASLRGRNTALDAEVVNLKRGLEAAEERARTDLGLIGDRETFYQVVPASASLN